jgi:hypothetical protein
MIDEEHAATARAMSGEYPISPSEAYTEMINLWNRRDSPELVHLDADKLLCNILKNLGYQNAVIIYESLEKWYG